MASILCHSFLVPTEQLPVQSTDDSIKTPLIMLNTEHGFSTAFFNAKDKLSYANHGVSRS